MNGHRLSLIARAGLMGAALIGLSLASASGWISLSLIDQIAIGGIAVVLPLVAGELSWWWAAATALATVALVLPRGLAAAIAVGPLVGASVAVAAGSLRQAGPQSPSDGPTAADVLALLYGVVAALALLQSRSGIVVLGVHEPFVELTAVHYTFAGAGALFLAARAAERRPASPLARSGLAMTATAPPVVALGFVTGAALPQVGGAILMALGVWATASLELRDALAARSDRVGSGLLLVSGLAVWAPMVLAVAWAAGQHWQVPVLSVPDMARTHGLANSLAFVVCGLLARRVASDEAAVRERVAA